jgi:ribonuclease Y
VLNYPWFIVILIGVIGVGLLLGYVLQYFLSQRQRREAENRARGLLQDAEKAAENKVREALLEAKDSWYQTKARLEQETEAARLDLQRLEKKILGREENLERKLENLELKERDQHRRDQNLVEREEQQSRREHELTTLLATQVRTLEQIARLTAVEAKQQLMERMLAEARKRWRRCAAWKMRPRRWPASGPVFTPAWLSNALPPITWWKARCRW